MFLLVFSPVSPQVTFHRWRPCARCQAAAAAARRAGVAGGLLRAGRSTGGGAATETMGAPQGMGLDGYWANQYRMIVMRMIIIYYNCDN